MAEAETFDYNGKEYKVNPTLTELLKDAGLSAAHIKKYESKLDKNGFTTAESLRTITKSELKEMNFKEGTARALFNHIQRVKRQGGMMYNFDQVKVRESEFMYLSTGSTRLDEMLTYSDGNVGLRSRTMTELYGEASMGKTQLCLTAAAMALRSVEDGGFGRAVAYIDSEGAFEGSRFEYLCEYWGVDREHLKTNLFYSRVSNFDEVELALEELKDRTSLETDDENYIDLGLIVVDSIIDPLKNQYMVGGQYLSNLQPRQQHLQQVLSMLKNLAENNNAIAIYTNHVRNEIGNFYGPDKGPQGGHVMAHASDIRIYLSKAPKSDQKGWFDYKKDSDLGLKAGRAEIVDSGFLPNAKGYYIVGPMGIADPKQIKKIRKQSAQIIKDGYLSVNALGQKIDPLYDTMNRDDRLDQITEQLYGEAK